MLLSYDDIEGDVARPPHLAQMIAAAETLGEDMDFVRADFHDAPSPLRRRADHNPRMCDGRFSSQGV